MRAQINFQSCWDGVNLYLPDQSHVAYLSGIDNGVCPPTHPVSIPGLFFEVLYFTNEIDQSAGGTFTFAQGDATGYGFHGDFINGWDMDVQTPAVQNCLYETASQGVVSACPYLAPTDDTNVPRDCLAAPPLNDEPVLGFLTQLPGCNEVTYGPDPVPQVVCGLDSNVPISIQVVTTAPTSYMVATSTVSISYTTITLYGPSDTASLTVAVDTSSMSAAPGSTTTSESFVVSTSSSSSVAYTTSSSSSVAYTTSSSSYVAYTTSSSSSFTGPFTYVTITTGGTPTTPGISSSTSTSSVYSTSSVNTSSLYTFSDLFTTTSTESGFESTSLTPSYSQYATSDTTSSLVMTSQIGGVFVGESSTSVVVVTITATTAFSSSTSSSVPTTTQASSSSQYSASQLMTFVTVTVAAPPSSTSSLSTSTYYISSTLSASSSPTIPIAIETVTVNARSIDRMLREHSLPSRRWQR